MTFFSLFRDILAYVYVPVVQRELDDFREVVWNNKKGRKQPKKALPNGKAPALIYEFPEACEGNFDDYAIPLKDEDFHSLDDVSQLQPVFDGEVNTYIPRELTVILDQLHEQGDLQDLETLELEDANEVYLYLHENFRNLSLS